MDPSSYVTFIFPNENNYRFLVERNLLAKSEKIFGEEELISSFSRVFLETAVKYLENPHENLSYLEMKRIYVVADSFQMHELKSKIINLSLKHFSTIENKKSDQMEGNEKNGSISSPENFWCSLGSKFIGSMTFPIRFTLNSTSNLFYGAYNAFVDGKHPWKEHRYAVILQQHAEHLSFSNESIFSSIREPIFSKETDYRTRYQKFVAEFRKLCQGKEQKAVIEKMAVEHFTKIVCLPFLTTLCLFLASKQNSLFLQAVLFSKELSFSEKFEKLKETIDQVDTTLKKPMTHTLYNKCEKLIPGFDSLARNNMPWKCLDVNLSHPIEGKHSITFIRSGVPVNDEGVVPEFYAFICGLKRENKKIAVMVHLDSSYFDTTAFVSPEICNDLDKLKRKESKWIEKIVEMEGKFPETMEVFLLPFDGKWVKRFEKEKQTLGQAKALLASVVKDKNLLLLSQSARKQDPVLIEQEVEEILNGVVQNHFSNKMVDDILSSEEKKAFLALFYHDLMYYYALKFKCGIVLNHCTDGRDRTAIPLFAFAARCFSLAGLSIKNTCDLIGTSFGPALALAKSSPHSGRWPYMLATAKQLEKNPVKNAPMRPGGWKVERFQFPEDEEQTLLQFPSQADTLEQYKFQLQEEREFPLLLPDQVTLPCIDQLERVELIKQANRDLPCMELFYQEEMQTNEKHFPFMTTNKVKFNENYTCHKEVENILPHWIKTDKVRDQILYFLTQTALFPALQKLQKRYENKDLKVLVLSGMLDEKVKPQATIKVSDLQLKVIVERKFPIALTAQEKREIIGKIKMKMELIVDYQENISQPVMKWKVL